MSPGRQQVVCAEQSSGTDSRTRKRKMESSGDKKRRGCLELLFTQLARILPIKMVEQNIVLVAEAACGRRSKNTLQPKHNK